MLGLVALPLLLASATSPIMEPTGTVAWLSTSTSAANARVYTGVTSGFRTHTSLEPMTAAAAGLNVTTLRACGGSFVCWVQQLQAAPEAPQQLLVTHVTDLGGGEHQVRLAMLDPELAAAAQAAAKQRHPGDTEAAEALIFEDAVRTGVHSGPLRTDEQSEQVILRFLKRHEGWLVRARQWRATSQLELQLPEGSRPGAEVQLGSLTITPSESLVRIERVRSGVYPLAIRSTEGRYQPLRLQITVPTSSVVQLSLPPLDFSTRGRALRQTARWTGVATFAAGTAFLVHSVVRAAKSSDTVMACTDDCDLNTFVPIGPLLEAPLGYSLMAAGAVWTTGSFVEGESYEAPLWSVIAGAVLGGAAYGLSAALD